MRVFLTGGTGFIGTRLTKALLKKGWEVKALVRCPESSHARLLEEMGAECVKGDVTDKESMRECMSGADMVIHNAGWYELGIDEEVQRRMHDINVTGTDNVLSLSHEIDVEKVVYVSSAIVFGETGDFKRDENFIREGPYRSYYEQSKAEAHEIAKRYQIAGLPLVVTCPNAVVGPNDHSPYGYMLRMFINNLLLPISTDAETTFSMVYVDDFVEGILLAASNGKFGETYLFAGESTTLRELISIWKKALGGGKVWLNAPKIPDPLLSLLEKVQRSFGMPAFISRETMNANVSRNFSSEKAKKQLGWRPLSASAMWRLIIEEELRLLMNRESKSLVTRLNPYDERMKSEIS